MRSFNKKCTSVLVLLLLSGCSVTKRGLLNDHTYFSNRSPNIQIEIATSFNKVESKEGRQGYHYTNRTTKRHLRFDHFIGLVNENNVDFYYEPSTWIFDEVPSDSIVDTGTEIHLGEKWYICYYILQSTKNGSCALNRSMRHFTAYHDVFIIEYLTMLSDQECRDWEKAAKYSEIRPGERAIILNEVQYEFLEDLKNDFESDVKVSNYLQP